MQQTVSFSGHETFPFRYGWLKKGVEAAQRKSDFYSQPDEAMIELGVGKNMVSSIKYWCQATGLLIPVKNSETGRFEHLPTELSKKLITVNLYDPYFEDPATLWLIHWQLASNIEQSTTWYFLFNLLHGMEFTKSKLYAEIQRWLEKNSLPEANENSLRRDIDICLRTYVHARGGKRMAAEDSLDCPLTELNLIAALEDGKTYKIIRGEQDMLPDEIFLYALEDFWQKTTGGLSSISLQSISYDPGSPGQIFKLDENSLVDRLENLDSLSDGAFRYDETAGLKQLYRQKLTSPLQWLDNYYKKVTNGI